MTRDDRSFASTVNFFLSSLFTLTVAIFKHSITPGYHYSSTLFHNVLSNFLTICCLKITFDLQFP